MSIYPLLLPGWDETSTWGEDHGHLYAQISPNGFDDIEGPQYWITPPHYPTARDGQHLAEMIGQVADTDRSSVLHAMSAGACLAGASDIDRRLLDLPE